MDCQAIIVGGGPAGATCAIWLKQLGLEPLVIEKRGRLGGLQNDSPYPNTWISGVTDVTGREFAEQIDRHTRELDVDRICGKEVTRVESHGSGFRVVGQRAEAAFDLQSRFLVIATGVRPRTGGIKAAPGIIFGPGHEVYDTDFRERGVAILGGGDNAFENYAFVREAGAACVKIFARQVKARSNLVAVVPSEDVNIGPFEVQEGSLRVNNTPFDRILVMFGWEPNADLVEPLGAERNSNGFIRTDPTSSETSVSGLYAIGEVANRAHPCCATAMADGVIAAKAIHARLED